MSKILGLAEAANLIWSHWQAGTVLDQLPEAGRPQSRKDGYAIQSLLARKSKAPPIGWKIAATSKAGQAHIGVDGPMAGRLLKERCFASGATLDITNNRMRVAEPEFCFRVGTEIRPRPDRLYSIDEAVAAMDALIPAIEVPDSRFADFSKAGGSQLIADVACAHEFVLGEPATIDWRSLDLASHAVHATIGARLVHGSGANVLDDPRIAVTWLVNELSSLGITLNPGEVITTGACLVPMPIAPGDHMVADFGTLGRVDVRFR